MDRMETILIDDSWRLTNTNPVEISFSDANVTAAITLCYLMVSQTEYVLGDVN
jgi:hypothetical protein